MDSAGHQTSWALSRRQQENSHKLLLERQVVHQAFLLQQVGFELATLAPSDWMYAGFGALCRLGQDHAAAAHFHSVPFGLAAKVSSVGISAWLVSTMVYSFLGMGQGA